MDPRRIWERWKLRVAIFYMQITSIVDLHQFDKLKENWDSVYAADPYATVFLSWAWLRGWFEVIPYNWLVLAVKPDSGSSSVAFLGLSVQCIQDDGAGRLCTLRMGGNPLADYTGFVCLPEFEDRAIASLAAFVQQQLTWDVFQIKDVFDLRIDSFLKYFSPNKFEIQNTKGISCPYVNLPVSWPQYLQDCLSPATRQSLVRKFRRFENLPGGRITEIEAGNVDIQIETLLTLWQMRWGVMPEHILNQYRSIFRRCFENHCLWLTILLDGIEPITGMVAFIDYKRKSFGFYITGFDEKFAKLSPGQLIVGYSIRYAIENGFQIYDFLRGDERYKFSFGALERFNTDAKIRRRI